MSLGTGAIKGGSGPVKIQSMQEPALEATTNQQRHTEKPSVEIPINTYCGPIPIRGGKGGALNWQNKQPQQ